MRQERLRHTLLALVLLTTGCVSSGSGPLTIDVRDSGWILSESIVRERIHEIPASWELMRDCHETMLLPEPHEFVFVEPTESGMIAGLLRVRCEYDLNRDHAYCQPEEKAVRVIRRGELLVVSYDEAPGLSWVRIAEALVDGSPEGWLSDTRHLYQVEVQQDRVVLSSGGCGCYSRLVAPLSDDGRSIGDVSELGPEICF